MWSVRRFGKGGFEGDDVSVRYIDGDTKADLYFYTREGVPEEAEGDPAHAREFAQVKEAFEAIEIFAKRAEGRHYRDLDLPEKLTVREFGDGLQHVGGTMRYSQVDDRKTKLLESAIWVTEFEGVFIKARYSFVDPEDADAREEFAKQREEFRADLCKLIAETAFAGTRPPVDQKHLPPTLPTRRRPVSS